MSLLTVYQNLKSVFSKFWKQDVVNEQGDNFGDLVLIHNGEVVPRWIGTVDNLTSAGKTDDKDDLNLEAMG